MGKGRFPRHDQPEPAADADRIIDAAMALIARDGWGLVSLAAVAEQAGLPILRVYRIFSSKSAILCGLARRIDEAVLAVPILAEPNERPRDRVFDLLMRRFDALQPYKPAFAVLRRELLRDPVAGLSAGAALLHSIAWMLEAAGTPVQGWRGVVTVKLTARAYVAAQRVWLRDDSPDLAPTMADLDQRLRGIERWFTRLRAPGLSETPAPT